MISFFFKRKKIVVDLFTESVSAYEYAKPTLAHKWFPNWWKELPKEYLIETNLGVQSTMKRCYGMTELYQYGFVVPLWTDFAIEVAPIDIDLYRWNASTPEFAVHVHAQEQRGSYLPKSHYQHIKIENAWRARANQNVPFLFMQPTWNHPNPEELIVPPGIVPISITSALSINMFIPRKEVSKTIRLDLGFPLFQLLPLDRRPVDLRLHLVDSQEMKKLSAVANKFTNVFSATKKIKSGCPIQGGA